MLESKDFPCLRSVAFMFFLHRNVSRLLYGGNILKLRHVSYVHSHSVALMLCSYTVRYVATPYI